MNIYIVGDNDIIHETSTDFVLRSVAKETHVVQYDNLLPIVKVYLFNNGERYVLPDDASVNLRFGKADHTFVYKGVLGCNESRDAVYFSVDQQMTAIDGKANPVLELFHSTGHLSSSPIPFIIDKNPIQDGDIESQDDFKILYEIQVQVNKNTHDIEQIVETGGEPNVLESISVNNIPVPIDPNKNSNLETVDEAEALSILVYGED